MPEVFDETIESGVPDSVDLLEQLALCVQALDDCLDDPIRFVEPREIVLESSDLDEAQPVAREERIRFER